MPERTEDGGSISPALMGKAFARPADEPISVIRACSTLPGAVGKVTVTGIPSVTREIVVSGMSKRTSSAPAASIS